MLYVTVYRYKEQLAHQKRIIQINFSNHKVTALKERRQDYKPGKGLPVLESIGEYRNPDCLWDCNLVTRQLHINHFLKLSE